MKHPAPKTIRFGLVGAGAIAQSYVQTFPTLENAQLVGIADVRLDSALALAELIGCKAFESYEEMAAEAQLDAVVVCTPPSTHPEICIFFLNRNIHVLCEKPLAIDSASARLMLTAAEDAGVTLAMASKFRYSEDVIRARSILLSGILGDIILYENSFTSRVNMSARWNSNPAISGGGVLIDNGTHSVDILRYLVGPIAQIQAVEGKRLQSGEVEETVYVSARTKSGVIGKICLSWSIQCDRESYIEIYGSQGTVSIGWKASKYRQISSPDWIVFGSGYNKVQALRSQMSNFIGSVRNKEMLLISPEDALSSVETIEAAYESQLSHQWTDIQHHPLSPASLSMAAGD